MKTGAVAFLDILGFKGIWQNRRKDDILQLVNGVPEIVRSKYQRPPPEQKWSATNDLQIIILSDTIVITINLDRDKEVRKDTEGQDCVFQLANMVYYVIGHFLKKVFFYVELLAGVIISKREILFWGLSSMMSLNGTKRLTGLVSLQHLKLTISSNDFRLLRSI